MLHLIWYILVGLIAGVIAKSVMHAHMTIFWTIVLGIIGSILGGAVTHMFSRPANARYHPAGLIFSSLGAILVLFVCYNLKICLPHVLCCSGWAGYLMFRPYFLAHMRLASQAALSVELRL